MSLYNTVTYDKEVKLISETDIVTVYTTNIVCSGCF
jgi:hypothetical protein